MYSLSSLIKSVFVKKSVLIYSQFFPPGVPWTVVENSYIAIAKESRDSWEKFLSALGVVHFLAIERKDVSLNKSQLVSFFNENLSLHSYYSFLILYHYMQYYTRNGVKTKLLARPAMGVATYYCGCGERKNMAFEFNCHMLIIQRLFDKKVLKPNIK